jgi:hypothetical protein
MRKEIDEAIEAAKAITEHGCQARIKRHKCGRPLADGSRHYCAKHLPNASPDDLDLSDLGYSFRELDHELARSKKG